MMYYTTEARASANERISALTMKIASIPGDKLNYTDATDTIHFLAMLREEIAKEDRRAKEGKR